MTGMFPNFLKRNKNKSSNYTILEEEENNKKLTLTEVLSKYNNFDLIDNEIKIIEKLNNIPIVEKAESTGLFIHDTQQNNIYKGYLYKGTAKGIGILSSKCDYGTTLKGLFYNGKFIKGFLSNLPKEGSQFIVDFFNRNVKILYNNGCIYERNKEFYFPTNDKNKKLELLTEFSCIEFIYFLISLSNFKYKFNTELLLNNNIDFNIFNSFLNDVDFLKYLNCLNINCIQAKCIKLYFENNFTK